LLEHVNGVEHHLIGAGIESIEVLYIRKEFRRLADLFYQMEKGIEQVLIEPQIRRRKTNNILLDYRVKIVGKDA
jgi:hypothetical protein